MVARVPTTVRWVSVVPDWITAAGVSAARPASTRRRQFSARFFTPMRKTRVPGFCPRAAQGMVLASLVGSSWPVMKVTRVV